VQLDSDQFNLMLSYQKMYTKRLHKIIEKVYN